MNNLLIIPVEIYQREYHAALCLAESALEKGYSILIGQKQQVFPYIESFRHSVWFLKSITQSTLSYQHRIASTSSIMYTHDIEGLVPNAGEIGIKMRYSKETIDITKGLFFWGQSDYNEFDKIYPDNNKKIHMTGTHVSDSWLIKSYLRSRQKRKNSSLNCLILSSFPYAIDDQSESIVQRGLGSSGILKSTGKKNEDFYTSLQDIRSLQIYGYKATKELIYSLNKISNITITLRQHPAESTSLWSSLTSFIGHYSNGLNPIEDDLLNSDCVFHFNSTASYQASILGISSCMYLGSSPPPDIIESVHPLILESTNMAYSMKDVHTYLESVNKSNAEIPLTSNSYLFFDSSRPYTSSDSMINIISNSTTAYSIANPYPSLFHIPPLLRFYKKQIVYRIFEYIAILFKKLKIHDKRFTVFYKNGAYAKRKWPGNPTIAKVKSLITDISSVRNRNSVKKLNFKRYPTGAIFIERIADGF